MPQSLRDGFDALDYEEYQQRLDALYDANRAQSLAPTEFAAAAAPPAEPDFYSHEGVFKRGLRSGLERLPGTYNALTGAVQGALGFDEAAKHNLYAAKQAFDRADAVAPQLKSYDELESLGDVADLIVGTTAQAIPDLLTSIGTGGLTGAAALAVGKSMAKKAIAQGVAKAVADQSASTFARRSATTAFLADTVRGQMGDTPGQLLVDPENMAAWQYRQRQDRRERARQNVGRVTNVVDGDTIDVEGYGRIRLANINTADWGQEGKAATTEYLRQLLTGKTVELADDAQGLTYGRGVKHVYLPDMEESLSEHLARTGRAMLDERYQGHEDLYTKFAEGRQAEGALPMYAGRRADSPVSDDYLAQMVERGQNVPDMALGPDGKPLSLQEQSWASLSAAIGAGMLDAIPLFRTWNKVTKGAKELLGTYLKRVTREMPAAMATEVGAEMAQTVIGRIAGAYINQNKEVLGEQGINEVLTAGVASLGFGFVEGAVSAIPGPKKTKDDAPSARTGGDSTTATPPPPGDEGPVEVAGMTGEQFEALDPMARRDFVTQIGGLLSIGDDVDNPEAVRAEREDAIRERAKVYAQVGQERIDGQNIEDDGSLPFPEEDLVDTRNALYGAAIDPADGPGVTVQDRSTRGLTVEDEANLFGGADELDDSAGLVASYEPNEYTAPLFREFPEGYASAVDAPGYEPSMAAFREKMARGEGAFKESTLLDLFRVNAPDLFEHERATGAISPEQAREDFNARKLAGIRAAKERGDHEAVVRLSAQQPPELSDLRSGRLDSRQLLALMNDAEDIRASIAELDRQQGNAVASGQADRLRAERDKLLRDVPESYQALYQLALDKADKMATPLEQELRKWEKRLVDKQRNVEAGKRRDEEFRTQLRRNGLKPDEQQAAALNKWHQENVTAVADRIATLRKEGLTVDQIEADEVYQELAKAREQSKLYTAANNPRNKAKKFVDARPAAAAKAEELLADSQPFTADTWPGRYTTINAQRDLDETQERIARLREQVGENSEGKQAFRDMPRTEGPEKFLSRFKVLERSAESQAEVSELASDTQALEKALLNLNDGVDRQGVQKGVWALLRPVAEGSAQYRKAMALYNGATDRNVVLELFEPTKDVGDSFVRNKSNEARIFVFKEGKPYLLNLNTLRRLTYQEDKNTRLEGVKTTVEQDVARQLFRQLGILQTKFGYEIPMLAKGVANPQQRAEMLKEIEALKQRGDVDGLNKARERYKNAFPRDLTPRLEELSEAGNADLWFGELPEGDPDATPFVPHKPNAVARGLDRQQQAAVNADTGVKTTPRIVVRAGAGSGKTRVLVSRVQKLLRDGAAKASQIKIVTFTNDAVNEINSRIEGEERVATTIHSLAKSIAKLGNARLLDTTAAEQKAFQRAVEDAKLGWSKGLLERYQDARARNQLDGDLEAIHEVYSAYKKAHNLVDFGDQIERATERLEKNSDYALPKYVLVDEYQDVTPVEEAFLAELSANAQLFVVGDQNQGIYNWRGAGADNLDQMVKSGAKEFKIGTNYRSSPAIVDAANALVGTKDFKAAASGGSKPVFYEALNGTDEEQFVFRSIQNLIKSGVASKNIAVLARASSDLEGIAQRFERAGERFEGVVTSTIHGAKGNEWDYVFVMGAKDNSSLRRGLPEEETARREAEERRIYYVAMTRAIKGLTLSVSKNRNAWYPGFSDIPSELRVNTAPDPQSLSVLLRHNGSFTLLDRAMSPLVDSEASVGALEELQRQAASAINAGDIRSWQYSIPPDLPVLRFNDDIIRETPTLMRAVKQAWEGYLSALTDTKLAKKLGWIVASKATGKGNEWFKTQVAEAIKRRGKQDVIYDNNPDTRLVQEHLDAALQHVLDRSITFGDLVNSTWYKPNEYNRNLTRRNWFQVKDADAVLAISKGIDFETGLLADAGTSWTVQMGIDADKPVFVFDQATKAWYEWADGTWEMVENEDGPDGANWRSIAGVGTRELTPAGEQAIENFLGTWDGSDKIIHSGGAVGSDTKWVGAEIDPVQWEQHKKRGKSLEVSAAGDEFGKQFSEFTAKLSARGGQTIAAAHKADVKEHKLVDRDVWNNYLGLWRQWTEENPKLFGELKTRVLGKEVTLTDKFAKSYLSSARALAALINEELGVLATPVIHSFEGHHPVGMKALEARETPGEVITHGKKDWPEADKKVREAEKTLYVPQGLDYEERNVEGVLDPTAAAPKSARKQETSIERNPSPLPPQDFLNTIQGDEQHIGKEDYSADKAAAVDGDSTGAGRKDVAKIKRIQRRLSELSPRLLRLQNRIGVVKKELAETKGREPRGLEQRLKHLEWMFAKEYSRVARQEQAKEAQRAKETRPPLPDKPDVRRQQLEKQRDDLRKRLGKFQITVPKGWDKTPRLRRLYQAIAAAKAAQEVRADTAVEKIAKGAQLRTLLATYRTELANALRPHTEWELPPALVRAIDIMDELGAVLAELDETPTTEDRLREKEPAPKKPAPKKPAPKKPTAEELEAQKAAEIAKAESAKGGTYEQFRAYLQKVAAATGVKLQLLTYAELRAIYPERDFTSGTALVEGGKIWVDARVAGEHGAAFAFSSLHHEIAHQLLLQKLAAAPRRVQLALMKAYNAWLKTDRKNTGIRRGAALAHKKVSPDAEFYAGKLEAVPLQGDPAVLFAQDNLTALPRLFHEWAAENIARWFDVAEQPRTLVDQFFQKLAEIFKALFQLAKSQKAAPVEQSIQEFMDGIWPKPTAEESVAQRKQRYAEAEARDGRFESWKAYVAEIAKRTGVAMQLLNTEAAFGEGRLATDDKLSDRNFGMSGRNKKKPGSIWINPDMQGKYAGRATFGTLNHEIGHQILWEKFKSATQETKNDLLKDYNRYVREGSHRDQRRPYSWWFSDVGSRDHGVQDTGGEIASVESLMKSKHFKEWAADHIARYLETDAKAETLVERFFKEVANLFKQMFGLARERGFTAAPSIQKFMNSIWVPEAHAKQKVAAENSATEVHKPRIQAAVEGREPPEPPSGSTDGLFGPPIPSDGDLGTGFDWEPPSPSGPGDLGTGFDGEPPTPGPGDLGTGFDWEPPSPGPGDLGGGGKPPGPPPPPRGDEPPIPGEDDFGGPNSEEPLFDGKPKPQGPKVVDLKDSLSEIIRNYRNLRYGKDRTENVEAVAVAVSAGLNHPSPEVQIAAVRVLMELFLHPDDAKLLRNATTSAPLVNQLRKTWPGGDAAIERLRADGDDAPLVWAMLTQYRAGMLQVGPKVETWLQKLIAFVAKVLGVVRSSERADQVFSAVQSYQLDILRAQLLGRAPRIALPEQLQNNLLQKAFSMVRQAAKPINAKVHALMNQSHREMDRIRLPMAQAIRALFQVEYGERDRERTYLEARDIEVSRYHNKFLSILGQDFTKDDAEVLAGNLIRGERPQDAALAAKYDEIHALFESLLAYQRKKGVVIGDMGKDYFPWVYDLDSVAADPDGLEDLILEFASDETLSNGLEFNREEFRKTPAKTKKKFERSLTDAERERAARNIVQAILEPQGKKWNESMTTHTPYHAAVNARLLKEIPAELMEPYLVSDLGKTVSSYILHAVKRAEFTERFGNGGEKLESMLAKLKKQGATPEQMQIVDRFIQGQLGTLNHNFSPTARDAMGWALVYENYRLLSTSLFSSIPDVMGIWVNSGDFGMAWKAMKEGIADARGKFKSPTRDLAQYVGIISDHLTSDMLSYEHAGTYLSSRQQAANDFLFKVTGQAGWTRWTRVAATAAATDFLRYHTTTPDETSEVKLRELGLKPGDVSFGKDGQLEILPEADYLATMRTDPNSAELAKADRLSTALNRWVNGAILRPNSATRPSWMNDPRFMLLAHFKGFNFSFYNTIMRNTFHRMGQYDGGTKREKIEAGIAAARLAMYVPVFLFAEALRDAFQHWGEEDPNKTGWEVGDHAWYAFQRAGLFGPLEFVSDAFSDNHNGQMPGLSALGPTVEHAVGWSKAMLTGGEEARDNAMFELWPAQSIAKPWAQNLGD